MAVKAVRGLSNPVLGQGHVVQAEVICQSMNTPEAMDRTVLLTAGQVTTGAVPYEICDGRSAMTGLKSVPTPSGGSPALRRLGGTCRQINAQTGAVSASPLLVLPSHGSHESAASPTPLQPSCADGEALVGLQVYHGPAIVGVRGICASVAAWRAGPNAPTSMTDLLGAIAPASNATTQTCGWGDFVVGWQINATAQVNYLEVYCRRL
jgi:hypothetical protein